MLTTELEDGGRDVRLLLLLFCVVLSRLPHSLVVVAGEAFLRLVTRRESGGNYSRRQGEASKIVARLYHPFYRH